MIDRCIYPGSFDPLTVGHADIIERCSALFDKVIIGILNNTSKKPLFSIEERLELVKRSTEHLNNISILAFEGLLVDFVGENAPTIVVRGLRSSSDFEFEVNLYGMNKLIDSGFETIFLPSSPAHSCISSSLVKEVGRYGGDISKMVPEGILDDIRNRLLNN